MAKGGEADPDCPTDVESYRYWTTKKKVEDHKDKSTVSADIGGQVNAQNVLGALGAAGPSPLAMNVNVPDAAALLRSTAVTAQQSPSGQAASSRGGLLMLSLLLF